MFVSLSTGCASKFWSARERMHSEKIVSSVGMDRLRIASGFVGAPSISPQPRAANAIRVGILIQIRLKILAQRRFTELQRA